MKRLILAMRSRWNALSPTRCGTAAPSQRVGDNTPRLIVTHLRCDTFRLREYVALLIVVVAVCGLRADVVRLGVVEKNAEVPVSFVFTNTGSSPVALGAFTSSCSCLTLASPPSSVAAGATVTIAGVYSPSAPGKIEVVALSSASGSSAVVEQFRVTGFVTDPEWLVSVADAAALYKTDEIRILDTRSEARYEEAHILRSINVPAFALKTRTDLRADAVVLVDEGYAPEVLLAEAAKLRQLGFGRVQVLQGGIAAWAREGNALAGNRTNLESVARISPADFAWAAATANWRVMEWEGPRSVSVLSEAAAKDGPLLIVASSESAYAEVEKRVGSSAAGKARVYYLAGGASELAAFRQEQTALAANSGQTFQLKAEHRATFGSTSGCGSCPK
jgi:rhodanese-related sulfurtransferase